MKKYLFETIAEFSANLRWSDVSTEIQNKADTYLPNGIGIGTGRLDTPHASAAQTVGIAMDGEVEYGEAMLRNGGRASTDSATLTNVGLFHGQLQEDTRGAAHLGAVLIPLLMFLGGK